MTRRHFALLAITYAAVCGAWTLLALHLLSS